MSKTPERKLKLLLGIPEIRALFNDWAEKRAAHKMHTDESDLAERVGKALEHLLMNPSHPGLRSHEIGPLSKRYGIPVFQSYIDNNSEHAWRIYWVYGPRQGYITWIGLEPHPEDTKSRGYGRVTVSNLPPLARPSSGASRPSTKPKKRK